MIITSGLVCIKSHYILFVSRSNNQLNHRQLISTKQQFTSGRMSPQHMVSPLETVPAVVSQYSPIVTRKNGTTSVALPKTTVTF